MREPHHPTCEELELPAVLHALSDPARLQIVRKLAEGDECTCGTFDLGLSKATLSHHFRVLRECGVVRTRPDGRKRMLSLREDDLNDRFPGLLVAVLTSAKDDSSVGRFSSARVQYPRKDSNLQPRA